MDHDIEHELRDDNLKTYFQVEDLLFEKGLNRTIRQLERAVYQSALEREAQADEEYATECEEPAPYDGFEPWIEEARAGAGRLLNSFLTDDFPMNAEEFFGSTDLRRTCWAVAEVIHGLDSGETPIEAY
jgi:hypothetical protein